MSVLASLLSILFCVALTYALFKTRETLIGMIEEVVTSFVSKVMGAVDNSVNGDSALHNVGAGNQAFDAGMEGASSGVNGQIEANREDEADRAGNHGISSKNPADKTMKDRAKDAWGRAKQKGMVQEALGGDKKSMGETLAVAAKEFGKATKAQLSDETRGLIGKGDGLDGRAGAREEERYKQQIEAQKFAVAQRQQQGIEEEINGPQSPDDDELDPYNDGQIPASTDNIAIQDSQGAEFEPAQEIPMDDNDPDDGGVVGAIGGEEDVDNTVEVEGDDSAGAEGVIAGGAMGGLEAGDDDDMAEAVQTAQATADALKNQLDDAKRGAMAQEDSISDTPQGGVMGNTGETKGLDSKGVNADSGQPNAQGGKNAGLDGKTVSKAAQAGVAGAIAGAKNGQGADGKPTTATDGLKGSKRATYSDGAGKKQRLKGSKKASVVSRLESGNVSGKRDKNGTFTPSLEGLGKSQIGRIANGGIATAQFNSTFNKCIAGGMSPMDARQRASNDVANTMNTARMALNAGTSRAGTTQAPTNVGKNIAGSFVSGFVNTSDLQSTTQQAKMVQDEVRNSLRGDYARKQVVQAQDTMAKNNIGSRQAYVEAISATNEQFDARYDEVAKAKAYMDEVGPGRKATYNAAVKSYNEKLRAFQQVKQKRDTLRSGGQAFLKQAPLKSNVLPQGFVGEPKQTSNALKNLADVQREQDRVMELYKAPNGKGNTQQNIDELKRLNALISGYRSELSACGFPEHALKSATNTARTFNTFNQDLNNYLNGK